MNRPWMALLFAVSLVLFLGVAWNVLQPLPDAEGPYRKEKVGVCVCR